MTENKFKSNHFLGDLGRPTKRGIRKCPKCGTFNGTRGMMCKNKACNVVFKESKECTEKKRANVAVESVKILTGSSSLVYSVKIKEKGPDIRGFVQLQSINNTGDQMVDGVIEPSTSNYCFVDSCLNLSGSSGLAQCQHLTASINSFTEAVPLTLKNSMLNNLPLPNKTRQSIWTLATQSSGPLVQRVSKQNLVVKCKMSSRNPLGLLHILFFDSTKSKDKPELRFQCGCRTSKQFHKLSSKEEESKLHCVHFYACLCAFASDESLSNEFAQYMFLKPQVDQPLSFLGSSDPSSKSEKNNPSFASRISEDENELRELTEGNVPGVEIMEGVELNLTDNALLGDPSDMDAGSVQTQLISLQDIRFTCVRKDKLDIENNSECFAVQVSGDENSLSPFFSMSDCGSLLTPTLSASEPLNIISSPSPPVVVPESKANVKKVITPGSSQPSKKMTRMNGSAFEESSISQSFLDWLASVTERINQTMHYQFSGKPDSLKFQVPNTFFECLQQRLSVGTNKKRLPNSTVGFVRKDALPIGTFTKYTWKITNIIHLKNIFDTPLIPLEVTRKFVKNRDDGFEAYYGGKESDTLANFSKLGKTPLIKPVEYKTFLRVGIMSGSQKEPIPFVIEWIPDVLPRCQIGEMTLTFEFGHLKNGQLVEWAVANPNNKVNEIPPTLVVVVPPNLPTKVNQTLSRKRKIQPNILSTVL